MLHASSANVAGLLRGHDSANLAGRSANLRFPDAACCAATHSSPEVTERTTRREPKRGKTRAAIRPNKGLAIEETNRGLAQQRYVKSHRNLFRSPRSGILVRLIDRFE